MPETTSCSLGCGWATSPIAARSTAAGIDREDPSRAKLPPRWYDRGIGVRVAVGCDEKTQLYVARTPTDDPENRKLKDPDGYLELEEVGGTSVIARRSAPRTCFVSVHLPFEGGKPPPIRAIRYPTASDTIVAVEVIDEGRGAPHDWLLLDLRDEAGRSEPASVEIPGKGQFLFANHAFVRVAGSAVDAWGDLRGLSVEAPVPKPTFKHNGRTTGASVDGGRLVYRSEHQ